MSVGMHIIIVGFRYDRRRQKGYFMRVIDQCCLVVALVLLCLFPHQFIGQSPKDIYGSIHENPSKIHWCSAGAGDDPAGIIGNRCQVYSDCLETAGLTEAVDQIPFPPLSEEQRVSLRKCHQALYNAARTNPQIKGAKATQIWLERDVYPGTESKSFPVPKTMQTPR
jgi:hypothetical protein